MVPRWNLGPRVCCSHMLVLLGARWYLGMCDHDSTASSFRATLITTLALVTQLPWRVPSHEHCILVNRTRIHSTNEQPWARMSWAKIPFVSLPFDPVFSPLYCSMRKAPHQFLCQNLTMLPLTRYLSPWQDSLAGNALSTICATVQERIDLFLARPGSEKDTSLANS